MLLKLFSNFIKCFGYFYNPAERLKQNPTVPYMEYARDRIFESYEILNKEFESRGAKIYNATHGGKLEVFERVRYEDLFE